MNFTLEELKNLSAFLNVGKWTINAQEGSILITLLTKINEEIKKQSTEPSEDTK